MHDEVNLVVGDGIDTSALWDVLPHQPVGVLIQTSFMMHMDGKEGIRLSLFFYSGMIAEFQPMIFGDGMDSVFDRGQKTSQYLPTSTLADRLAVHDLVEQVGENAFEEMDWVEPGGKLSKLTFSYEDELEKYGLDRLHLLNTEKGEIA